MRRNQANEKFFALSLREEIESGWGEGEEAP